MKHVTTFAVVMTLISCAAGAGNGLASNVLEKKYPFPSPLQWKVGTVEISLIAVAWGPADSPEMISKGREKIGNEKPEFPPELPYVLALGFQATAPGRSVSGAPMSSGLLLVKNAEGDLERPMILTPTGLANFSGSPGVYDIYFNEPSKADYWDFFPASPDQKEFLFQAPVFAGIPGLSPSGEPRLSFRIIRKDLDFVIINASPPSQMRLPDFTKSFTGTIGSASKVNLKLTKKGTTLSGTQQYVQVGQTLWLKGQIDSLGNFVLEEQYPEGHATGIFKGKFSEDGRTMRGYFSKPDESRLQPFEFREVSGSNGVAPR